MDKKAQQLGMKFGTASNRLRKSVMFMLVQRCGLDVCHRCGEKILNEADLTIEHKQPWLDVDPRLFWDLNNIAFSHHRCNVADARRPNRKYSTDGERKIGQRQIDAASKRRNYSSEKRKQKYLTKGY